MPVPSGSPRGYPGSPKHASVAAAEQDIPPCLLHLSQEISGHGGGSETSPAFGTHQIQAAAKRSQERKFYLSLVQASAARKPSGTSNQTPHGCSERWGNELEKPSNVALSSPAPALLPWHHGSPATWSEQWHRRGHGMAKVTVKKKKKKQIYPSQV